MKYGKGRGGVGGRVLKFVEGPMGVVYSKALVKDG